MAALGQALVKLALDSILQQEIGEEIRSSTFAASETLHQLSWVAGGLAGLAMSLTSSGVAGPDGGRGRAGRGPADPAGPAPPPIVEGRRAPSRVAV